MIARSAFCIADGRSATAESNDVGRICVRWHSGGGLLVGNLLRPLLRMRNHCH